VHTFNRHKKKVAPIPKREIAISFSPFFAVSSLFISKTVAEVKNLVQWKSRETKNALSRKVENLFLFDFGGNFRLSVIGDTSRNVRKVCTMS
jgi:hypothetical protein